MTDKYISLCWQFLAIYYLLPIVIVNVADLIENKKLYMRDVLRSMTPIANTFIALDRILYGLEKIWNYEKRRH